MAPASLLSYPWIIFVGALAPAAFVLRLIPPWLRRRRRGARASQTPTPPGAVAEPPEGLQGEVYPLPYGGVENPPAAPPAGAFGPMYITGPVVLPAGASVRGAITSTDYVEVGEGTEVVGNIVAGGDVVLQPGASVDGIIVSRGSVSMGRGSAAIAVVSRRGTTLADGVRVARRVASGEPIVVLPFEVPVMPGTRTEGASPPPSPAEASPGAPGGVPPSLPHGVPVAPQPEPPEEVGPVAPQVPGPQVAPLRFPGARTAKRTEPGVDQRASPTAAAPSFILPMPRSRSKKPTGDAGPGPNRPTQPTGEMILPFPKASARARRKP